ncbi:MAG: acyl carrier protein [Bdellovibrionota bacterium]|nr:MAG: acyl carrier protein [Pseudomonadota bacterium]
MQTETSAALKSDTDILSEVRNLIEEIIGQSVDMNDEEISLETSFSRDLEMESIEFVVLSEKLQQSFGSDLDFASWLASKELGEIINLKVSDIVGFVKQCQA